MAREMGCKKRTTKSVTAHHAQLGQQLCAQFFGGGMGAVMGRFGLNVVVVGNGTIAHDQDAVGQQDGLIHVVRDQQHARTMTRQQLAHQRMHADAGQRIEGGKGFIQQQQARLAHQGTRQCHALCLATGEVTWPVIESTTQPDLFQRRLCERLADPVIEAQGDIAPERIPRDQARFLEHHGWLRRAIDATAVDGVQARQRAQQGGLAAAALAQQGHELATADAQVQPLDHGALTIAAPEACYLHGDLVDTGRMHGMHVMGGGAHHFPLAAQLGCQASRRRSSRRAMASETTPMPAQMTMVSTITSVCRNSRASMASEPIPVLAAMVSAITSASQATASAQRTPARMEGKAPGSTMRRINVQLDRPVTRPSSSSLGSTWRMPSTVLMQMGKSTPSETRKTLPPSPTPNHTITSGSAARKGTARTICTLRSNKASARREKPTSVPSTKPRLPPMTKPAAARRRLAPRSLSRRPCPISLSAVCSTLLGAGSTCGESTPARAKASQSSSKASGAAQEMRNRLRALGTRGTRRAGRSAAEAAADRLSRLTASDMGFPSVEGRTGRGSCHDKKVMLMRQAARTNEGFCV
eukprot:TRINITY_DN1232_c0_g1_i1.p3 TRINITY_DN1232_c0_g1~~TRINITY_DN1232_c0_g1_i1.p3  ORF type:complete len:583 (+),score=222.90 TRINITY_DN1232_c0_g1_i1:13557-15305(+)